MSRVDIHGKPVSEGLEGLVSMGDKKDSGKFMYYRMGSNGYISTGPAWATERERREEKGDIALRKYGQFGEADIHLHKYKRIFSMGGAKEFSLAQIIDCGWHRNPPKDAQGNPVHFSQLDDVNIIDHKCGYCGKLLLGCKVNEDGEVVEDDINRRRHESIVHKDISGQEQLGRTLATALAQINTGSGGGPGAETLAIFAKMVSEMQERQKDQDKLIVELTERMAGQPASEPPAVESGPQTMARKKGKK